VILDIIRTSYFTERMTLLHSAKQSRVMQNRYKRSSVILMVIAKCLAMGTQHTGDFEREIKFGMEDLIKNISFLFVF